LRFVMVEIREQARRTEVVIVIALTLTYFLLYSVLSVLRHTTYHSFGPDLGLFDQIFWNTTQGHSLESTMSQAQPLPHSYFSDHFSPIYALLLPFYWILPHPQTLLVLQTLALAMGAVPVYLLAREMFRPGSIRIAWVVAYFLFLPLAFINLFDFHELAFAVLPLGLALYFVERRQPGWFLLSLLAAFLVKEELPLVGVGFGLYILLQKRDLRLGLGVVALSGLAFFAIVRLVIPAFGGGAPYAYFAERYAQLGTSPQEILRTMLTNPRKLVETLFQAQKLKFLIGIFGPVLGLSVLSGFGMILLLPTLATLLLSNYAPQFAFTSHYSAPLIALVLGTAILGLARLDPSLHRPVSAAVVASSLVFSFLFGDLPFSRHFDPHMFQSEPRYAAFAGNLDRIPPDASVAAENNLTSHLSHRRLIYNLEYEGPNNAEYLALDDAALGHNAAALQQQIAAFEAQGYRTIATGDGLALLQRP
jgi:uncharacterized membrane protein